ALATGGFGAQVRQALKRRSDELVRQGHASRTPHGGLRIKADLIGTPARQEVQRVGRPLAAQRRPPLPPLHEGPTAGGKLLGSARLASGRFAMIDDGLGFSLVPWRPVLEKDIGRPVMGECAAATSRGSSVAPRGLALVSKLAGLTGDFGTLSVTRHGF